MGSALAFSCCEFNVWLNKVVALPFAAPRSSPWPCAEMVTVDSCCSLNKIKVKKLVVLSLICHLTLWTTWGHFWADTPVLDSSQAVEPRQSWARAVIRMCSDELLVANLRYQFNEPSLLLWKINLTSICFQHLFKRIIRVSENARTLYDVRFTWEIQKHDAFLQWNLVFIESGKFLCFQV